MRQTALTLGWAVATAMAADTMKVAWTTDEPGGSGAYGPDGPWQAISVRVGNSTKDFYNKDEPAANFRGAYAAMWPSGGGISMLLTKQAGGNYTPSDSSTSKPSLSNSDTWMASVAQEENSVGFGVSDIISLKEDGGSGVSTANASLAALDKWEYILPDNSSYTANVGILGLGPPWDTGRSSAPQSILESLKTQGKIASMTFGLHIGSVAFNQPGSLVLGGYERNRALGVVGTFEIRSSLPFFSLLDVTLGTQLGTSPFTNLENDSGSIWQGLGNNSRGSQITKNVGGDPNSATMIPNPSVPYIYLPLGTCEAAAKRLPVTWNPKLGLYTWNTNDPAYERIVRSPAYLGFVLSDRTKTNITIKVPFRLLNLTLESPLTPTPTPYFPCKPLDSSYGFWMLGRAFLQAAFFGLDLEHSVTFLAQAPGPAMGESVVRALRADITDPPETNPISEFETSWMPSWTVLGGDEKASGGGLKATSLSTGAIVGTVVAIVALWGL